MDIKVPVHLGQLYVLDYNPPIDLQQLNLNDGFDEWKAHAMLKLCDCATSWGANI